MTRPCPDCEMDGNHGWYYIDAGGGNVRKEYCERCDGKGEIEVDEDEDV